VANDILADRVTVIQAGAPVTGTVTKVRRGVANHQWAELRIHIEDVPVGHSIKLRLSSWAPVGEHLDREDVEMWILFPIGALFLKHLVDDGWGLDGPPKPDAESGEQAVLPQCLSIDYWVVSAKSIPGRELRVDNADSTTPLDVACPRILERSRVYESLNLERVLFR
jgi:hypothetical protein